MTSRQAIVREFSAPLLTSCATPRRTAGVGMGVDRGLPIIVLPVPSRRPGDGLLPVEALRVASITWAEHRTGHDQVKTGLGRAGMQGPRTFAAYPNSDPWLCCSRPGLNVAVVGLFWSGGLALTLNGQTTRFQAQVTGVERIIVNTKQTGWALVGSIRRAFWFAHLLHQPGHQSATRRRELSLAMLPNGFLVSRMKPCGLPAQKCQRP